MAGGRPTSTVRAGEGRRRHPPRACVGGGALLLALVLGACSGAGGGGASGPGAPRDPNGVLRVGYDFSLFTNTFDPQKSNSDCDAQILQPIYGSLLNVDSLGNLSPGLVQSWTVDDPTTITLHVRPGVRFSDNTAFDAAAIKAGLLHNASNPRYTDLTMISSMDVVDPLTLRVHLNQPATGLLLGAFASYEAYIPSSNSLAEAGTHPVGAGPFLLAGQTPGGSVTFKPNPLFWNAKAYELGGLRFLQVATGPPAVTALLSNSVDWINPQADSYPALKADPAVRLTVGPTNAYFQFQFRFTAPFDKLAVRQAAEYAINRDEINQKVLNGLGTVTYQNIPAGSPAHDPSLDHVYSYDPARAKELLQQAGYAPGQGPSITIVIPGGGIAVMEGQARIIQQNLQAVGFKVGIDRINPNDIATNYYQAGVGNAFAAEILADTYLPNRLINQWGKGQFVAIYSKGENQQITDLMNQALASTDPQVVDSLVRQGEQIVSQQALEVPIAFVPQIIATSAQRVGGTIRANSDVCSPYDFSGVYVTKH